MASTDEETQVPKKKKFRLWVLLLAALVSISACTYIFYGSGIKNLDAKINAEDMKSVTLPSFTVNLADTNSNRFLRTTITLEFSSDEVEEELKVSAYKVKDGVLQVLRNTQARSLENPESTELLKQQLLKEVNSRLTNGGVTGIYFEEFIVQ